MLKPAPHKRLINAGRHHARQYHSGLYMITSICGLIDAFCFLALGGVFAEMMTGNFLLLALSIGTGTFFSDGGHFMIAIAAFTVGAFIGGLFVNLTRDKGQFQRTGFVVEWVVLVAACILAINTEPTVNNASGITLVVMLAFCMGIQNAIVRSFSVPDLATNVMTLTFTAIIAESKAAKGGNKNVERRIGSVLIFMCSAILGALLLRWHMTYPIILATLLFTIALYPLLFGHHEACKH